MRREIGLFAVTSWGVGIILGAGIYVLVGEAAGIAGNSVWLSFIIGAMVASLTGLSYAELSSVFPRDAAEYVYVKIACGCEILSFMVGWLTILTGIIAVSTVALGFAGYLQGLFGFPRVLAALILILVLSYINFLGIKESTRINILFTLVEVAGLVLLIAIGLGSLGSVNLLEAPNGSSGILSAAALIFFAYLGFEDIVNIAEETKKPEKAIPKALILSILITTFLYVLVALVSVSLVDWQTLGPSNAPLAFVASQVLGENAFTIMSVMALFATSNTVLIMLVVGSRMIYGMAKEGAFPRVLSRIHPRKETPWPAILVTMFVSIVFLFMGDLELVAALTSFGAFITFAFVNISLIYIRYRRAELERPFRAPLNVGKFPITGFLGLLTCLFLVSQFNTTVILSGSIFLFAGVVLYKLSKIARAKKPSKVSWKKGNSH
ncbi:MAG: amino acid permease [Candidatus Bathyarchaeota archaeon]|nr:MAG: amino acid permease [Candidatus Bathyarchaeota archaeon]